MRVCLSFFLLAIIAETAFGQPGSIVWQTSGLPNHHWNDIQVVDNNEIYLLGVRRLAKVDGSGTLLWTQWISGQFDGYGLQVTSNMSIYIAGGGGLGYVRRGFVYVTDSTGSRIWNDTYGFGENNQIEFRDIALDDAGDCIVSGYWVRDDTMRAGMHKISSTGDSVWSMTFPQSVGWEEAFGLTRVPGTDSFVAVGATGSWDADLSAVKIWRFDTNGSRIWSRTALANSGGRRGLSIIPTADGGFAIAGFARNNGRFGQDALILKTDSNGFTQWYKKIGGLGSEEAKSLVQLPDHGYILVGNSTSFGNGNGTNADWFVMRTDSAGNLIWWKAFGTIYNDGALSVQPYSDTSVVISGYSGLYHMSLGSVTPQSYGQITLASVGPPAWRYRLQHLHGSVDTVIFSGLWPDVVGTVEGAAAEHWSVLPGGDGNNGDSIIFVTDLPLASDSIGDFVLSHASPQDNLVRWSVNDIDGVVTGPTLDLGVEPSTLLPEEIGLRAYPNPFNLSTTLEFTLNRSSLVKVEIFDVLGQRVKEILNTRMEAGVHSIPFVGYGGLSSGVYFARLQADETTSLTKLLLLK